MNSKHHVKIKNKSHKKRLLLVERNSELLSIFKIFGALFWPKRTKFGDFFEINPTFLLMIILRKEYSSDIINNSNKENED